MTAKQKKLKVPVLVAFDVILEREKGSGYYVYCPELPGCHSQGKTRSEALANMREAIKLYIERLKGHD